MDILKKRCKEVNIMTFLCDNASWNIEAAGNLWWYCTNRRIKKNYERQKTTN